jgi:Ca2+/H+ antiporter, TMEM165/GDT1 family
MSIKLLTWLSTYLIIILCELGDKTQVAVLLLTSNNPRKRWIIFGASSLALVLCVTLEVTLGMTLARYVGPALINRFAGGIFLLLGLFIMIKNRQVKDKTPVPVQHGNNKSATIVEAEAET